MIFLTGHHAAGKTTVAKALAFYNFTCLELGTILREKWHNEAPEIKFNLWYRSKERTYGQTFTDRVLVKEIKKQIKNVINTTKKPQDLILVGNRSLSGIQYIINKVPLFNNRKNIIIFISAPTKILKKRYCVREKKQISFKNFQLLLKKDRQLGIETIIPYADFKIYNNGSKQQLMKTTKKIIFSKLKYSSK